MSSKTVEFLDGDIAELNLDAANSSLMGGDGADGAIHEKDGWEQLNAECRKLGGCRTGEAKIAKGYRLKAGYIIHTVGPVYDTEGDPEKHLSDCYTNSLNLA